MFIDSKNVPCHIYRNLEKIYDIIKIYVLMTHLQINVSQAYSKKEFFQQCSYSFMFEIVIQLRLFCDSVTQCFKSFRLCYFIRDIKIQRKNTLILKIDTPCNCGNSTEVTMYFLHIFQ